MARGFCNDDVRVARVSTNDQDTAAQVLDASLEEAKKIYFSVSWEPEFV